MNAARSAPRSARRTLAPKLAVTAGPGVGADAEEVGEGQEAADEADAGGGVVAPPHRHLRDAVALLPGQEERLDVEGEAVDARGGEDRARRLRREELEAALRVHDAGHGQRAHEEVEEPARVLAVPRLA